MKVGVRKLREIMALLVPVIPRKPKLPVLNHVLLRDGKAVASDLENTLILEFPEATEALLIHRDTMDFLRFIPGDTIAEISEQVGENRTLQISCGGSRRTCPFADPDDYPPLPLMPNSSWHLDGDRLLEALGMATHYVCKDGTRPVLAGVTLQLNNGPSFVASGDGYRMFLKEIAASVSDLGTIVIPQSTVSLLKDLWKKGSRPADPAMDALLVDMVLSKRLISLGMRIEEFEDHQEGLMISRFGEVTLLSRLIMGTPPDWRQVIPQNPSQKLKVFAQDFYRSLLQLEDIAGQGSSNKVVRLSWADNTLKITATGMGQTAEAECFATVTGENGHIAVNIEFLLDYLKGKEGVVEMGVLSPDRPIRCLDGKSTVVIMPVFVAEDRPQEKDPQQPEEGPPDPEKSDGRGNGQSSQQGHSDGPGEDHGPVAVAEEQESKEEKKEPVAAATTPKKPRKTRKTSKAKK